VGAVAAGLSDADVLAASEHGEEFLHRAIRPGVEVLIFPEHGPNALAITGENHTAEDWAIARQWTAAFWADVTAFRRSVALVALRPGRRTLGGRRGGRPTRPATRRASCRGKPRRRGKESDSPVPQPLALRLRLRASSDYKALPA
jgi:hypothetical protein